MASRRWSSLLTSLWMRSLSKRSVSSRISIAWCSRARPNTNNNHHGDVAHGHLCCCHFLRLATLLTTESMSCGTVLPQLSVSQQHLLAWCLAGK